MSDNESTSYNSETSEDDYIEEFVCPKCETYYDTFEESEYKSCNNCSLNYCKNCSYYCYDCRFESCFRCNAYTSCCEKNKCTLCTWRCDFCHDDHCDNCLEIFNCVNCEEYICNKYISKDHKISLCLDCCNEYCYICLENNYENPCSECLLDLKMTINRFNLPVELNRHILSYIY